MIDPFFEINPKTCQPARLIPSISDSKKEEKATSILLATFRVVPAFAFEILTEAKAPTGKTAKIDCFTDVTFETSDKKTSESTTENTLETQTPEVKEFVEKSANTTETE